MGWGVLYYVHVILNSFFLTVNSSNLRKDLIFSWMRTMNAHLILLSSCRITNFTVQSSKILVFKIFQKVKTLQNMVVIVNLTRLISLNFDSCKVFSYQYIDLSPWGKLKDDKWDGHMLRLSRVNFAIIDWAFSLSCEISNHELFELSSLDDHFFTSISHFLQFSMLQSYFLSKFILSL